MKHVHIRKVFDYYDTERSRIPFEYVTTYPDGSGSSGFGHSYCRKVMQHLIEKEGIVKGQKDKWGAHTLEPNGIHVEIPMVHSFTTDDEYLFHEFFPDYNPNFEAYFEKLIESMVEFKAPDTSDLLPPDAMRFNQRIYEDLETLSGKLQEKGFVLQEEDVESFSYRVKGPGSYMSLTSQETGEKHLVFIGPYSTGVEFQ